MVADGITADSWVFAEAALWVEFALILGTTDVVTASNAFRVGLPPVVGSLVCWSVSGTVSGVRITESGAKGTETDWLISEEVVFVEATALGGTVALGVDAAQCGIVILEAVEHVFFWYESAVVTVAVESVFGLFNLGVDYLIETDQIIVFTTETEFSLVGNKGVVWKSSWSMWLPLFLIGG